MTERDECEHGNLRRKCPICDRDELLDRLAKYGRYVLGELRMERKLRGDGDTDELVHFENYLDEAARAAADERSER